MYCQPMPVAALSTALNNLVANWLVKSSHDRCHFLRSLHVARRLRSRTSQQETLHTTLSSLTVRSLVRWKKKKKNVFARDIWCALLDRLMTMMSPSQFSHLEFESYLFMILILVTTTSHWLLRRVKPSHFYRLLFCVFFSSTISSKV